MPAAVSPLPIDEPESTEEKPLSPHVIDNLDDDESDSESDMEEHVHGPECDHYEYPSDAEDDNSTYSFHHPPSSNKKQDDITSPSSSPTTTPTTTPNTRTRSLSGRARAGRQRATRCQLIMKETALLARMTLILYSNLGIMGKWVFMLTRLCLFALFLLPAFYKLLVVYFTDKCILKNIKYGVQARNYLDIYLPQVCYEYLNRKNHDTPQNTHNPKKPVVIFMTGGAWTIGYKGWGALVGISLKPNDVIVVTPDYRNFPQGVVPDMVDDTRQAVWWVYQHIHLYGGDRKSIYLVGQSAGAHISLLTIIEQAKAEAKRTALHATHLRCLSNPPPLSPQQSILLSPRTQQKLTDTIVNNNRNPCSGQTWKCSAIRGVIGVSGPYDLVTASEYLHGRGLHRALFSQIMDGSFASYSPTLMLMDLAFYWNPTRYVKQEHNQGKSESQHSPIPTIPFDPSNGDHMDIALATRTATITALPPIFLLHGRSDVSVRWQQSQGLCDALTSVGAKVQVKYYDGLTHTDPILENPMSGVDPLMHDVTAFIHSQQLLSPLLKRTRTQSERTARMLREMSTRRSMSTTTSPIDIINTNTHTSPIEITSSRTSPGSTCTSPIDRINTYTTHVPSQLITSRTITPHDISSSSSMSSTSPESSKSSLPTNEPTVPHKIKPKAEDVIQHRMAPLFLIKMARYVNPF